MGHVTKVITSWISIFFQGESAAMVSTSYHVWNLRFQGRCTPPKAVLGILKTKWREGLYFLSVRFMQTLIFYKFLYECDAGKICVKLRNLELWNKFKSVWNIIICLSLLNCVYSTNTKNCINCYNELLQMRLPLTWKRSDFGLEGLSTEISQYQYHLIKRLTH